MTPPLPRRGDRPDPPRLASRLAQRAAGDAWGDVAAGDLTEEYAAVVVRRGRLAGAAWYWRQALALAAHAAGRRVAAGGRAVAQWFFLGDRPMHAVAQEVRLALRGFVRQPVVTTVLVLTLALGLGANAATLGWIDGLLLHPFAIPNVDRLVMISENSDADPFPRDSVSAANYLDLRQHADVFDATAAFTDSSVNLSGGSEPERLQGASVSGEFFAMLSAVASRGRLLSVGDEAADRSATAVISDSLWKRRFGGDPDVVGRVLQLDGLPYAIVGVAAPGFDVPSGSDVWTPLAFTPETRANRARHDLTMLGRLRDGVTFDHAAGQAEVLYQQLKTNYPDDNRNRRIVVRTFTAGMVDIGMAPILLLWQAAAALLLLIACINVANLLLARGAARQREFAVRTAIGAGRWRLVRQLLIESLTLGLVATPFALVVAAAAFNAVRSAMPAEVVRFVAGWTEMGITLRIVGMTIAAAIGASVLFGVIPAIQASRPTLTHRLRDGGRSVTATRSRWRRGLVVAEIALALPLLVASALAILGAHRFATGPQGYDPAGLLKLRTVLPQATYPDADARRQFTERLLAAASAIPGVSSAATTSVLPSTTSNQQREVVIDGRPDDPTEPLFVGYRAVSATYLPVMRMPLLQGRGIEGRDQPATERVAVVSQALAARFFPSGDAIGRRVKIGRSDQPWITIVGITGNTIDDWLILRNDPLLYVPVTQWPNNSVHLVVRTAGRPEALADQLRRALTSVDPAQPAFELMTMSEALRLRTIGLRFISGLMAVFGTLALLLSTFGIYGVMAHYVAQRRQEMGIRLALGGRARDIVLLTLAHGARMSALGIAIGVVAGLLLARLLERALFGIVALEPWLLLATAGLLAAIAAAASLVPARHAARVDLTVALRGD